MQNQIGCELYIDNSKELYHFLYDNRKEIESRIPETVEWMELPSKKASRIKVSTAFDFNNQNKWNEAFEWSLDKVLIFLEVFGKLIKDYGG